MNRTYLLALGVLVCAFSAWAQPYLSGQVVTVRQQHTPYEMDESLLCRRDQLHEVSEEASVRLLSGQGIHTISSLPSLIGLYPPLDLTPGERITITIANESLPLIAHGIARSHSLATLDLPQVMLCALPPPSAAPPLGLSELPSTSAAPTYPLSSVPNLQSKPDAPITLFLRFTGAAAFSWSGFPVPTTPAFSIDGDTSTFTDAELAAITEIWARVAEKYVPFNINVSTFNRPDNPSTLNETSELEIIIGGSGSWSGGGGVAALGSFASPFLVNRAFVFSQALFNNPKFVAEAAAHEAGHQFSLMHQSVCSGSSVVAAYRGVGATNVAPLMGYSYDAVRGVFTLGTSQQCPSIQDDLAILTNSTNRVTVRPDDIGATIGTAVALVQSGSLLTNTGIIEQRTDEDLFSFSTSGGATTVTVNATTPGPTLNPGITLLSSSLTAIASHAPTNSTSASVSATLAPGTYYVRAFSVQQEYGNVGSYRVSVTTSSGGSTPTPTATATAIPPTATPTQTPTSIPPTSTATSTATPSPTATPLALTATPTRTPTATPVAPTVTATPTRTATHTPTTAPPSPTPTRTASPSPTMTPAPLSPTATVPPPSPPPSFPEPLPTSTPLGDELVVDTPTPVADDENEDDQQRVMIVSPQPGDVLRLGKRRYFLRFAEDGVGEQVRIRIGRTLVFRGPAPSRVAFTWGLRGRFSIRVRGERSDQEIPVRFLR